MSDQNTSDPRLHFFATMYKEARPMCSSPYVQVTLCVAHPVVQLDPVRSSTPCVARLVQCHLIYTICATNSICTALPKPPEPSAGTLCIS